jgi:hypothetical protein
VIFTLCRAGLGFISPANYMGQHYFDITISRFESRTSSTIRASDFELFAGFRILQSEGDK